MYTTYYDDAVITGPIDDGEREIVLASVRTLDSCACKIIDTYLKVHLYSQTTWQWAVSFADGKATSGGYKDILLSIGTYVNLGTREQVASIRLGATADDCKSEVIYDAPTPFFPGYSQGASEFE